VDIPQFAFPVEYFLRPFSGQAERFRKGPEKFDDLRDMVVIFSILGARLRIK
jgi:hypothetical protein